jgi:hypothetical protein
MAKKRQRKRNEKGYTVGKEINKVQKISPVCIGTARYSCLMVEAEE